MTVRELIATLANFDLDLEVLVCDDDGNEQPIISVQQSVEIDEGPIVGIFVS